MGKYLDAELYKVCRRLYPRGFLAVMLGGITFFLFLIKANAGPGASFNTFAGALALLLSVGLYLIIVVCDMVFSEQYKHNTLKNEVSYGLPRERIYLGKLIAAIVTAVALCAIILAFFLGLARLLFPVEEGIGETMLTLGQALVMAFPLWLGGLGFFLMLSFVMKGSTAAAILYAVILSMGGGFLDLFILFLPKLELVFTVIQNCLLITPFNQISSRPMGELIPYAWVLGMAWFVLSTVIGLACFQKREIA